MVQTIRIEAEAREQAGKGAARATRRQGLVPAVIYGAKKEATLAALDPRDVMKELSSTIRPSCSEAGICFKSSDSERSSLRKRRRTSISRSCSR